MGKKGGGLLHQAQKAAKQSIRQGKKQQQQGPAAKRHKAGGAGGGSGYNLPAKANQQQAQKKKAPQPKQHTEPTIPFAPDEAILLLGEGDLSFAASLATHYGCTNLTATVLERNLDELAEKYPHVHANIAKIYDKPETLKSKARPNNNKILYNIDARKFPPFVHKPTNKPLMDRIIFNFPHVGGKSTDVNRQVRYNQELLVDFFRRAVLSLSPGGTIIVTLFEGEPYTLWNIRDLARHSGLQVERSFRFQWGAYPGYGHVRTLGVLRDRKSGEVTGGGWKGEERLARSYVFVRKGEEGRPPGGGEVKKKKRKRGSGEGDESSSSSEDEEDYGDHEEEEGDEGGEDEDEEDGDE
ncbi:protein of unknown function (DUF2431) domain containing protein [Naviculisporaceae sp. PSN 640]